jgi:hypothetical protein
MWGSRSRLKAICIGKPSALRAFDGATLFVAGSLRTAVTSLRSFPYHCGTLLPSARPCYFSRAARLIRHLLYYVRPKLSCQTASSLMRGVVVVQYQFFVHLHLVRLHFRAQQSVRHFPVAFCVPASEFSLLSPPVYPPSFSGEAGGDRRWHILNV